MSEHNCTLYRYGMHVIPRQPRDESLLLFKSINYQKRTGDFIEPVSMYSGRYSQ